MQLPGEKWPSSSFFILGSQRSGTTLMRLVLSRHSSICCLEEQHAYAVLSRVSRGRPLTADRLGFKVPQLTEQFANPVLRDDAAIRNPSRPPIANWYANQKVLFMIRDARDTVSSMKSLHGWYRSFGHPVLMAKVNSDVHFRQRYRKELDALGKARDTIAAGCALIWRYKTDSALKYRSLGFPVFFVQYERLVAEPRAVLISILRFLDLDWEESILTIRNERSCTRTVGGTMPNRSIDDASVGRWKAVLSLQEERVVLSISGATQTTFYGECPPHAVTPAI